MAWDDDKSTATDPDNPSASEQLTADEWDNHVGDQLSRLEYGPLSSRPAASEREQGALWFDEYGRISRVDANGNWVLDSFGTSSNPVPDTSHFNAISTDEALNSAIGDSVNYIDPRWLARTDAFIFSDSELNISNYEGGTSGSGSKGDAIFGTELSTGTTSGSSASLINGIDPSKATPLWDKSRSFRTAVDIQTDTTSRIDYYTTGRPQNGSDGFGFKLAEVSGTPTLQGVVHNGVSETTTDLITSPGTGKRNLRAEYTAGSDVTFYVDGTNEGAISSGLPSGSDEAVVPCVWYVENTSGVDRGIRVSEIWMVQLP